jgi:hypothetical protein
MNFHEGILSQWIIAKAELIGRHQAIRPFAELTRGNKKEVPWRMHFFALSPMAR